ncbi:fimbrial protein, partial [Enterobacter hormaechei]
MRDLILQLSKSSIYSTKPDLEFGARYIQTQAAITAGPANSVSTFTVIYN